MPDNWPPRLPVRVEGDSDRVALLIPGVGYSAERPLLHFARAVFLRYGWTTQEVWWPQRPPQRGQDLHAWFAQLRSFVRVHVSQILDSEKASKIALAGKSMGAFAAASAADRGVPGIWLTPVLRDYPQLASDLRRSTAPFLLVGGTADPSWDPELARSFGQPVYEADNADHGMETDDDPVNSAEVLRDVTIAMDAFIRAL